MATKALDGLKATRPADAVDAAFATGLAVVAAALIDSLGAGFAVSLTGAFAGLAMTFFSGLDGLGAALTGLAGADFFAATAGFFAAGFAAGFAGFLADF